MSFKKEQIVENVNAQPSIIATKDTIYIAWADAKGIFLKKWNGKKWNDEETISKNSAIFVKLAVDKNNTLYAIHDSGGNINHSSFQTMAHYKNAQLMFCKKEEAGWKSELFASIECEWLYLNDHLLADFTFDTLNVPHIIYKEYGKTYYATKKEDSWITEKLSDDSQGDVAIDVDQNNTVHLLFCHDFMPIYANGTFKKWNKVYLGEKYDYNYFDIAIDSENQVHALQMKSLSTADRAVYQSGSQNGFNDTQLLKKGNNGFGNRIKVDSNNVPHIYFRKQTSKENASSLLMDPAVHYYGKKVNERWIIEEVTEGGWFNDMTLDNNDILWIAFATNMNGGISVARYLDDNNIINKTREETLSNKETDVSQEKGVTYLEYSDEQSNKFWEIAINGRSHTVTYGKIGTKGQRKTKEFSSEKEAKKEAQKLISSKLKKGYLEKNTDTIIDNQISYLKIEQIKTDFLNHLRKASFPDYITKAKTIEEVVNDIAQSIQPVIGIDFKESKNISIGQSKIGGKPHLPKDYTWPTEEDDEDSHLAFICQINFAEVADHDPKNILPKKGMLYLFSIYNPDRAYGYEIDDSTTEVIFIPNPKNLLPMEYPETLGEDGQFEEKQLSFSFSFAFQDKDDDGLPYPSEKRFDYSIENTIVKTLENLGLNKGYLRMLGHPFFFRDEFIVDYNMEKELLLLHVPGETVSDNFGEGEFHLVISKDQLKRSNLESASVLFEVGT